MYFFCNTKQDGRWWWNCRPRSRCQLLRNDEDAWYVPLMTSASEAGGNIWVPPPDFQGDVPDGYISVRPATYKHHDAAAFILIPVLKSLPAGNDLVKQVKVYPLSKAANHRAQRLLDLSRRALKAS